MVEETTSDLRERRLNALYALAKDTKNRSKRAQLRDIMEGVEVALGAGVSRQAILDTLSKHGLEMTMNSFESALYHIRRERRGSTKHREQQEVQIEPEKPDSETTHLEIETKEQRRKRLGDQFIGTNSPLDNPLFKSQNQGNKK